MLASAIARRQTRWTALLLGCVAAAAVSVAANHASAQVNAGLEGGVAYRFATPSLTPGLAYGAHAEGKPIPILSVGAYYLAYDLGIDGAPSTVSSVAFRSFGGRVRFTLPLPGSNFRPFAYAGVGYVSVSYPMLSEVVERDGHFVELPIGLGVGYKLAKLVELTADVALRPGFGFGGDAYDGPQKYDESNVGLAAMLGAAVDL
ncbi:MAG: outer membrane beta-barrel protein [Polyangiaceae bacterium]|jgi:hypothetical protein|nr:outer membrane beta-barrel protein [Polyangiaceae bacterium]